MFLYDENLMIALFAGHSVVIWPSYRQIKTRLKHVLWLEIKIRSSLPFPELLSQR